MAKSAETYDLSKLTDFLHRTFVITEDVRNVLKSNCNEANFSLKPWCMEVVAQQDTSKDVCICPKAGTEVEEIAAGISRTLLQTQQLREKLSTNVIKGNSSSHLSASTIYNPQATGKRERKYDTNLNTDNRKLSSCGEGKNSKSKTDRDKKLTIRSEKSVGNKNFLVINKQSIKNMNKTKTHKDDIQNSGGNFKSNSIIKFKSTPEKKGTPSTSELKCLIQKVSSEINNYANQNHEKCPLHGNVISQSRDQTNFENIDVVDSIKLSNIPGEVVKSLKLYHTYLNNELSEKLVNDGKLRTARSRFLMEFNKTNDIVQKALTQKTRTTTLLTKHLFFFQMIFSKNDKTSDLDDIKTIYTELKSASKMCELKEFDNVEIFKSNVPKLPVHIISNSTEWMSNGIWNFNCITNCKEILTMCCIRYNCKNYLLLFFELLQQLQHTHYHKKIIDMLLKEVLPYMEMFDSTQSEYIKMYKMIYILYQGLNPKVPVLVSTNK